MGNSAAFITKHMTCRQIVCLSSLILIPVCRQIVYLSSLILNQSHDPLPGFAYKRPFACFMDYFWPLCPSAMHKLNQELSHRREAATPPPPAAVGLHSAPPTTPRDDSDSAEEPLQPPTTGFGRSVDPFLTAVQTLLDFACGVGAEAPAASDAAEEAPVSMSYQIGRTKVFLKGHLAASLDRRRTLAIFTAATRIQAAFR